MGYLLICDSSIQFNVIWICFAQDEKSWYQPQRKQEMEKMEKTALLWKMMTTYFPSLLLIAITFATTFFKPFFFEAALSVNLTTVLVLTTIFISKRATQTLTSGFFVNSCHSLKWFLPLRWSSSESFKWLAKNKRMKRKRTHPRKFQGMSITSMFWNLWVSKVCLNIVYVWSSALVFFFRDGSVVLPIFVAVSFATYIGLAIMFHYYI